MSLKEQVYSVLVVSSAEKLNESLREVFLQNEKYSPVQFVSNTAAAKRTLADRSFDFVVINSPLPDDSGYRLAADVGENRNMVVLLLVKEEIYDETFSMLGDQGVFLLSNPTSRQILLSSLDWMMTVREKMRKTEAKSLSLAEKMEEIRIVNRAKWILISVLKMEEPAAHKYIEKQAMNRCITKREIAEEIIKTDG